MRKIRLEIEELAVESFDTGDGGGRKGTVRGHASAYVACNSNASNCQTCQVGGCPEDTLTCIASCAQTGWTSDELACAGGWAPMPCIKTC